MKLAEGRSRRHDEGVRRPLHLLFGAALGLAACGDQGEMTLVNRLDTAVGLEVRAPVDGLRGGCDQAFRDRFCAEEYEIVGVLDFDALETRPIVLSGDVDDEHCTNVLWLRLVWLGAPDEMPLGPAADPGALISLPATVEVEEGTGLLHGVAFPGRTVRIDEVGSADPNQDLPPPSCEALGRSPRT